MGLQINDYRRVGLVVNKRDPGANHAVAIAHRDLLPESGLESSLHVGNQHWRILD